METNKPRQGDGEGAPAGGKHSGGAGGAGVDCVWRVLLDLKVKSHKAHGFVGVPLV